MRHVVRAVEVDAAPVKVESSSGVADSVEQKVIL